MLSLISAVVDPNTATIRLVDVWHASMIAVRECGGAVDYLLAWHKTARQRGYELCLFSKNCGNTRTWLAYSTNCHA